MKKNMIFAGLGVVLAAFITFLLRLINAGFFQDNLNMLIVVGVLGIVALVIAAIKKMNKSLLWLGAGVIGAALAEFLVRLTSFNDNVTLFVVLLVVGLVTLVWGLVKGK